MALPRNLRIADNIHAMTLPIARHSTVHATNGTYTYEANLIVPTTLAGFQFVAENDRISRPHDIFMIGVNSDLSLRNMGLRPDEDEQTRAMKVAVPLALQHPDRTVVAVFYNEETPDDLYSTLKHGIGADLRSLHKWGYGTAPDAPIIIGSNHADLTLGFPLPNDIKPVCHTITPVEAQPHVHVFKLTERNGDRGPYISAEGRVLFPVSDPSLTRYTQAHLDERRARFVLSDAAGITIENPPKPGQP